MNKIIEIKDLRPGFFKNENNKCRTCEFKHSNAGTHHLRCTKTNAIININTAARAKGWANWPIDFDPIWIDTCDSYYNENQYNQLSGYDKKILIKGFLLYLSEKIEAFKNTSNLDNQQGITTAIDIMEKMEVWFLDADNTKEVLASDIKDVNEKDNLIITKFLLKISKI